MRLTPLHRRVFSRWTLEQRVNLRLQRRHLSFELLLLGLRLGVGGEGAAAEADGRLRLDTFANPIRVSLRRRRAEQVTLDAS